MSSLYFFFNESVVIWSPFEPEHGQKTGRNGPIEDMNIAPQLIIAAAASFAVGSFLYIVIYYFIYPLLRYRKVKNQVVSDLIHYSTLICSDDPNESIRNDLDRKLTLYRKHALELGECFHGLLPNWYKLMLSKRKESPGEASKNLMALYNTSNLNHATARINMIRLNLKL